MDNAPVRPPAADLLTDGVTLETDAGDLAIRRVRLGELAVPSGRVLACDPLTTPPRRTLSVVVRPGLYPVDAGVIDVPDLGERFAWAMLCLGDAPVDRWLATPLDGETDAISRDDPGISAFADAEAAALLLARLAEPQAGAALRAEIIQAISNEGGEGALELPLDDGGGLNVVLFASGVGPDAYPTATGYGNGPEPLCLLTDFLLVQVEDE